VLRTEVLTAFTVVAGEIKDEGVWEGAPVFAPYFYAEYRRGRKARTKHHRGEDVLSLTFDVTDTDHAAFPELEDVVEVHLFVDVERKLEFVALDPIYRRLGGRRPNVEEGEEDDEDADEDEGR
jgi:hypothetical protein